MRAVRLVQRSLTMIPIMLGIALLVFVFMRLLPGDPVDIMMGQEGAVTESQIRALRAQFRLDRPVPVQFGHFMRGVLTGDLGESLTKQKPVLRLILERLPATIELACGALAFGLAVALPIGILSATRRGSGLDRLGMAGAFLGISMPAFWLGIVLIQILAVRWHVLPVGGRMPYGMEPAALTGLYVLDALLTGDGGALVAGLRHLALPSIALGAVMAALVARVVRSSMLEALSREYVVAARARGVAERWVVAKHALRNAMLPTVTLVGLEFGVLLSGNMIVETVFGWPGIGRLVVDAIFARDYPVVQSVVMFYAFIFVAANLIVDLVYSVLDPRVTL